MKNILVAVDGSPTSLKAANKAVDIAKKYSSTLTFLSVVKDPDIFFEGRSEIAAGIDMESVMDTLTKQHKNMLDEFVTQLPELGDISYEKLVTVGDPYKGIITAAVDNNSDLIVIGRRGFSKIKRLFFGSVSKNVVTHSPCPVLVITDDEEYED